MDMHIGDLLPSIVGRMVLISYSSLSWLCSHLVDREIEIVHELQNRILVYDQAMGHACDVTAELDVLLSFAEASRTYNYQRPQMVGEPVIDIVQGRYVDII